MTSFQYHAQRRAMIGAVCPCPGDNQEQLNRAAWASHRVQGTTEHHFRDGFREYPPEDNLYMDSVLIQSHNENSQMAFGCGHCGLRCVHAFTGEETTSQARRNGQPCTDTENVFRSTNRNKKFEGRHWEHRGGEQYNRL